MEGLIAMVACCGILVQLTQAGLNLAGPYTLVVNRLEKCPNASTDQVQYSVRLHKKSNTEFLYRGPWVWPYDLDSRVGAKIELARWGSRGWGLNAYNYMMNDFCNEFKKLIFPTFKKTRESIGADLECPLKAGNYTCKEWVLAFTLPFAALPYGYYRVDIIWIRDKILRFGCIRMYLNVMESPTQ